MRFDLSWGKLLTALGLVLTLSATNLFVAGTVAFVGTVLGRNLLFVGVCILIQLCLNIVTWNWLTTEKRWKYIGGTWTILQVIPMTLIMLSQPTLENISGAAMPMLGVVFLGIMFWNLFRKPARK